MVSVTIYSRSRVAWVLKLSSFSFLLLISGRPLEELLDELREEERKKMEAEAAVENPSVDDKTDSDVKDDNPVLLTDDEDKIKDGRDSGLDLSDDMPVH